MTNIHIKYIYILFINIGNIIFVSLILITIILIFLWCSNSLPNTNSKIQFSICKCNKCNKY